MANRDDTLAGRPTDPDATVGFWLKEIKDARTREKSFRTDGERILKIYDGTNQSTVPFNILFSNTETLLPAIYSAVPRPVVQRRFKDDDPLGKYASQAGTRMLEFLLDTNLHDYDPFDVVMRHTVLDGLLPGRGAACVTYTAQIEGMEDESTDAPNVSSEMVCLETKNWSRVYYGYAKKWSKVPWVAFEEYIDKKEATRLFGQEIAEKINYTHDEPEDSGDKRSLSKEETHQGAVKTACVYQIWDRQGGKLVKYVSAQYPDGVLKEEEDPLGLSGFFPCPKPLQFLEKTHSLTPTALYKIYENQATELNNIQLRLNALVRACKARGIYDSGLGSEIQKLMEADDNELVPAESASSLAADKGLQNAIWFMPLEVIQSTLQTLYNARESCKQVIYEITGISDILRGASSASETATAQNIKNQWGTLRLKRLQKTTANYARDLLRLMLELAASKFSEETWAKMTGLPFITSQQAQQIQMLAQIAQQTGQPLDPQIQAKLQAPIWNDVLALLRDDITRAYRIDIETNSTVEPEAAEDQKNISDLMMALAQYLNGVGPLIAKGVLPFEVAQSMMLAISRRFRFGNEIEDYLKQMKAPPPADDGGKQQAAQAAQQAQAMQAQMQMQQKQGEMALQVKTMQDEKALLEKKVDLELRELQLKADQEKFVLMQQVAQEKQAMRDQVHSVKVSTDDKVRTLKEVGAKREAQAAHLADTKLASSVGAIQSVTEQMKEINLQSNAGQISQFTQQMLEINQHLLQAVQAQAQQTSQVLGDLKHAIAAPKVRKAVRGKDGRIEGMVEVGSTADVAV